MVGLLLIVGTTPDDWIFDLLSTLFVTTEAIGNRLANEFSIILLFVFTATWDLTKKCAYRIILVTLSGLFTWTLTFLYIERVISLDDCRL